MKRTRGFVTIGTWMRWPAPNDGCESRCGNDPAAREQLCRHRADDRAAGRVPLADDLVHERHGLSEKAVPAGLLGDIDGGPLSNFGEQQHDGAGLLVNLVALLPLDVFVPRHLVAAMMGGEGLHVHFAEGRRGMPMSMWPSLGWPWMLDTATPISMRGLQALCALDARRAIMLAPASRTATLRGHESRCGRRASASPCAPSRPATDRAA